LRWGECHDGKTVAEELENMSNSKTIVTITAAGLLIYSLQASAFEVLCSGNSTKAGGYKKTIAFVKKDRSNSGQEKPIPGGDGGRPKLGGDGDRPK
jgi:hypothetical protein